LNRERLAGAVAVVTTFETGPDPNIELLSLVRFSSGKILRTEKWDELAISPKSGLGRRFR